MIKNIKIKKYRKLALQDFEFKEGVNILSGTNGTCKTSLLHIISNSFQAINKTSDLLVDKNCIEIIKAINNIINPKIESLTRGDRQYNDPAPKHTGVLYECNYFNGEKLEFRKHNSKVHSRFSVKPKYQSGSKDSLPKLPIIYLGLSRLYAYGEYQNDDAVEIISKKLPQKYLEDIVEIYKEFTGIDINYSSQEKMGDIKTRAQFSSKVDGIDSNTISAGEDNLFIILTALISLKYYYESINSTQDIESILLIDEIDATLHPAFQIKLLGRLMDFSIKYKIQVFFTTHSLTLLEEALNKKNNVVYLIDNIDSIIKMEDVDIYKIKMNLKSQLKKDIYISRNIPIFTEDEEARLFLKCLFEYYHREYSNTFSRVKSLFHLVGANISASNLINIFQDSNLLRTTMRSICILDGDQSVNDGYTNHIIVLPGKAAPEKLIFEYIEKLYNENSEFWIDEIVREVGYTKVFYRDNIKPEIEEINKKMDETRSSGKSIKGLNRELNKEVFNRHNQFFEFVIKHWINSKENKIQVEKFYRDLKTMFKKVSEFHDINSNEWKDEEIKEIGGI